MFVDFIVYYFILDVTIHCTVVLQQQCDNATLIRFIYTYISHIIVKSLK